MSTKKSASPAPNKRPSKRIVPARKAPALAEAVPAAWLDCVRAAEEKKAASIRVLDLRPVTTFADYFVLCNGTNKRQTQAIADEVARVMKLRGELPMSMEGYDNGEWILVDYGDIVVHVFTDTSRTYYDLDRLWREAPTVPFTHQRP